MTNIRVNEMETNVVGDCATNHSAIQCNEQCFITTDTCNFSINCDPIYKLELSFIII